MRSRVGDRVVTIVVDHEHVLAHRRDFLVPFRRVLGYVARALPPSPTALRVLASSDGPVWVRRWIVATEVVGWAGVVRAGRSAFWAYRRGRATPSHLVHGRKRRTRRLTFFGRWDGPNRFLLRSVYAGNPAPREIHDPHVSPAELDAAIAFWAAHAIVVAPGDYTREPAPDGREATARRGM